MSKLINHFFAVLLLSTTSCIPVYAQESSPQNMADKDNPFANRGGELPQAVRFLIKQGVKLTSIGTPDNIPSYLGESPNGRYQTFYITPDGHHFISGILFESGGVNITSAQIKEMLKRFNEAAKSQPNTDTSDLVVPPDTKLPPPDPKTFIDWQKSLGNRLTKFEVPDGGVEGYLIETKSNDADTSRMQPFYVFPGGRLAAAGILWREDGTMVTGLQIAQVQKSYLERTAIKSLGNADKVSTSGLNKPTALSRPSVDVAPSNLDPKTEDSKQEHNSEDRKPNIPDEKNTDVLPIDGSSSNDPHTKVVTLNNSPISTSPLEAANFYKFQGTLDEAKSFMEYLKTSVFFTVGVKGAPAVWMVVDPQCPFCHRAWSTLKQAVFDGRMQVRVIMISGLSGSEPLARSILGRDHPDHAWLQGEGSVENFPITPLSQLGSRVNDAGGSRIIINNAVATKLKIDKTPFLAYTNEKGELFTSIGLPSNMDNFLAALKP